MDPTIRACLFVVVAGLVLCRAAGASEPKPGDTVVVDTTEGQTFIGEIQSADADDLVLDQSGVIVHVPRARVERVIAYRAPAQRRVSGGPPSFEIARISFQAMDMLSAGGAAFDLRVQAFAPIEMDAGAAVFEIGGTSTWLRPGWSVPLHARRASRGTESGLHLAAGYRSLDLVHRDTSHAISTGVGADLNLWAGSHFGLNLEADVDLDFWVVRARRLPPGVPIVDTDNGPVPPVSGALRAGIGFSF